MPIGDCLGILAQKKGKMICRHGGIHNAKQRKGNGSRILFRAHTAATEAVFINANEIGG